MVDAPVTTLTSSAIIPTDIVDLKAEEEGGNVLPQNALGGRLCDQSSNSCFFLQPSILVLASPDASEAAP